MLFKWCVVLCKYVFIIYLPTSYVCNTIQDQCNPLYIASQNGHSSTVEVLIKAGANVNAVQVVSFKSTSNPYLSSKLWNSVNDVIGNLNLIRTTLVLIFH